ncbi:type II toxin-antitoxin system prevent-host-death family antitoxin [Vulcanococcus sp. Clear-D1]|uniref:type II toxin-antitoxin system Phd/YefM family antitoxin n=1 Tax=Vulcanococcus sp. Clear-D1 TaxID=2766970 RepID=UPI0025E6AD98|nr:type II toxin-antitoxin system prevent-host-death family antitoxin [Vulcanococcus sp. Clear-D1]
MRFSIQALRITGYGECEETGNNGAQAKAHLSDLLNAVESGEEVEITRRGFSV